MATDIDARAKFRRYWAVVSPGVALIRRAMLVSLKQEAERRVAPPAPAPWCRHPDRRAGAGRPPRGGRGRASTPASRRSPASASSRTSR